MIAKGRPQNREGSSFGMYAESAVVQKEVACPDCGATGLSKDWLQYHQRAFHRIEPEPEEEVVSPPARVTGIVAANLPKAYTFIKGATVEVPGGHHALVVGVSLEYLIVDIMGGEQGALVKTESVKPVRSGRVLNEDEFNRSKYLTIRQTANRLNIKPESVITYINNGKLVSVQYNGQRYLLRKSIEHYQFTHHRAITLPRKTQPEAVGGTGSTGDSSCPPVEGATARQSAAG